MNTLEQNSMTGYTAPEIEMVELMPEGAILQGSAEIDDYDLINHSW